MPVARAAALCVALRHALGIIFHDAKWLSVADPK
jgi:hypothetical protein